MPEGQLVEVYRPKNGLQAHMYVGALEEVGIRATLDSPDAASVGWTSGEAEWASGPRILVFEQDVELARRLLLGLEAIEREPGDDESDDDDSSTSCLSCGQPIGDDAIQCAACGWSWRG